MAALFRRATPVVLAFGLQATSALALGTAFTYQGTLGEGGSPANGNYDLTFSLYNAASAGTQVGSTVTNKAVAVTNGLFAVTVDFGAVFDGTQLWVQMGVRTNGGGSFTTLTPRQELTPTPYALYSPNAGVAVTADTATAVAAGSVSSGSIQAGSIMASNLNLTNVTAALGGPFWSLAGNAGTTPGVNFVGTTDNEALQLDAAGVRGLQLQYVSRVSAPPLLYRQSGMNVIGGFWGNSIASTVIGGTVAGGGDAAGFFPVTGYPNTVTNDFGTVGGGYANTAGYAGTVPGGYNNIASGTASFAAGAFAEATNNYSFVWSDGSTLFSSGNNCFDIHAGGGIHVNNSDIFLNHESDNTAGLSYRTNTIIQLGLLEGIYGPFLYGFNGGVLGTQNPEEYSLEWDWHGNVWVSNNLASAALNVDSGGLNGGSVSTNALTFGISSGEGIASKRVGTGRFDLEFYTAFNNRVTILQDGNVGVNTTTPSETLEINGTSRLDNNDMYMRAGTDRNHGVGYRNTLEGIFFDGPFLYGFNGGALGVSNPDTISLKWYYDGTVWISNNCSVASLTIRGGSDVAEPFPVTGKEVEPGTVMVIDKENPGQLLPSTEPYDTCVAGITSGAGGIKPGLELRQEGVMDQGQKVALSGRVYVKADASAGSIVPGDLLTTSSTPGHAMKACDHARAQGAILGKAMTGLKEGQGLVLVLVTLQ